MLKKIMQKDSESEIAISMYIRGRVSVPRSLAEKIGLKDGDNVILRVHGDGILLKRFDKSILQKVIR